MPTCWHAPLPISQALCLSKEPSKFSLCLKIHIERVTFASGGWGTKSHVLFWIRALYSSSIVIFQFRSFSANTRLRGRGDLVNSVWRLMYFWFRLKMPCWLLVTGLLSKLRVGWQMGGSGMFGGVNVEGQVWASWEVVWSNSDWSWVWDCWWVMWVDVIGCGPGWVMRWFMM